MDLPDSDRGDFSCRRAVDSSSYMINVRKYFLGCWTEISWIIGHSLSYLRCGKLDIDGLVQERHNSIANALKLCLSYTNPWIWCQTLIWQYVNFLTGLVVRKRDQLLQPPSWAHTLLVWKCWAGTLLDNHHHRNRWTCRWWLHLSNKAACRYQGKHITQG